MTNRKRVLIIDDSAAVRQALSDIINGHDALEVMATAGDPFQAAERIKQQGRGQFRPQHPRHRGSVRPPDPDPDHMAPVKAHRPGIPVVARGSGLNRRLNRKPQQAAVAELQAAGLRVTMIKDVTPIPHNGCRPPKRRRV